MAEYDARIRSPHDFGLVLQQARDGMGVSQRELARRIGLSQRAISEMESGRPTLWARRLFELLEATGVQLTAQWADDEDRG
ncbi:helix-turn-helix domain-containing protein [Humibacter ginsengisoli]